MRSPAESWRALLLVTVCAGATVVAADIGLRRVSPPPAPIMEVDEGVAGYERSDPDTLVLGSSHARSFLSVAEVVEARTGGRQRLAIVPLEWGTCSSYNWVLQNRLRPLIEEVDGGGRLRRSRLSRALIVTNFYDVCPKEHTGSGTNLPARAWTLRHFLEDVRRAGLTDRNRNYLQSRWQALWRESALVTNRGHDRIPLALRRYFRRTDPLREHEEFVRWSRKRMEEQFAYCDDPEERGELAQIIDYFEGRGVGVTVVLFPLMPGIVTERAQSTTLRRFADRVADLRAGRRFKVADMTLNTPVGEGEFEADLDHLTAEGSRKFTAWALQHELRGLLDLPP